MQNYNFFLTYTTLSAKNTSVRDIFLFCTEKCIIFSLFQYFKDHVCGGAAIGVGCKV